MPQAQYTNDASRNDYNIASSQSTQDKLNEIAAQIETQLTQREADVRATLAVYQADGASEKYHQLEQNWLTAAAEVRQIIADLRAALASNDEVAQATLAKAAAAIHL